MTLELARELKNAGFPFRAKDMESALAGSHREDCECLPTLSELIAACGGGDTYVGQPYSFSSLSCLADWTATGLDHLNKRYCTGAGSTPEEAVARLWLALKTEINQK